MAGLGQYGVALGWGGTEKRGGETKILKRRGKLGQGADALKKGEGWNPLANYLQLEKSKTVLS